MLTDVETRYANIYRECLSVCFGLEKFHTYIYGRHITVQNDHKPLEMIQRNPIQAAPQRLQCMSLRLQKYDYKIQYIKVKMWSWQTDYQGFIQETTIHPLNSTKIFRHCILILTAYILLEVPLRESQCLQQSTD